MKKNNRKNKIMRVRMRLKRSIIGKLRLSIFKSNKHFYAQLLDDDCGRTLVHVSTLSLFKQYKDKNQNNSEVVSNLARLFVQKSSSYLHRIVVFDRRNYSYIGMVAVFCDTVRSCGMQI